ncbi:3-oxoacyl-[acyl-carrier-protein] synthase 3 [Bienertia sinuspersici]
MIALSLAASTTLKVIRCATEAKRKSLAKPCHVCKEKGFYICKICKGNASIQWSPLYDPIHINPCQCPICDGHRLVLIAP